MKLYIITIFALSVAFNVFSQKPTKLSDPDKDNIAIAEKFANSYFELVKKDQYYAFTNEATDQVKHSLTEDLQKNVYKQLSGQFGEFNSMEYVETWTRAGTNLKIHRFKADFNESVKKLEVRVVLDQSDKIAGFFVFPWSDMLK